jgi:ribose transport system substrate-binding protein
MTASSRHRGRGFGFLIVLPLVIAAFAVTACGSDDEDGASKPSDANAATDASPEDSGIAGVPTMEELYKGTESAPPDSGPKAEPGKFVIYLSCGEASAGCSGPGKAAKEAADVLGWKFKVIDGKYGVGGAYITGMKQAVAQQPDAILTYALDCSVLKAGLDAAKAANIPVLSLLASDCNEAGETGPDLLIDPIYSDKYKTADEFWRAWGAMRADYLINALEGKAKVVNMYFDDTVPGVNQGFTDELAKCPDCEMVVNEGIPLADAGIPNGPVVATAKAALLKNPDANALVAMYDGQVLGTGLLNWLKNSPYKDSVTLVGGEGSDAGMEALRQGPPPTAEVGYSNGWVSWAAMDAINRHLNDSPQVSQGLGFRIIDKSNVPAGGYESEFDYEAAYKKAWGVG